MGRGAGNSREATDYTADLKFAYPAEFHDNCVLCSASKRFTQSVSTHVHVHVQAINWMELALFCGYQ